VQQGIDFFYRMQCLRLCWLLQCTRTDRICKKVSTARLPSISWMTDHLLQSAAAAAGRVSVNRCINSAKQTLGPNISLRVVSFWSIGQTVRDEFLKRSQHGNPDVQLDSQTLSLINGTLCEHGRTATAWLTSRVQFSVLCYHSLARGCSLTKASFYIIVRLGNDNN
jgi:hypothetical protein